LGFVDDYIKNFQKGKERIKGRFKVIGQVVLGLMVGATLYFHPDCDRKGAYPGTEPHPELYGKEGAGQEIKIYHDQPLRL